MPVQTLPPLSLPPSAKTLSKRLLWELSIRLDQRLQKPRHPDHAPIVARCSTDLEAFAREFFPHLCTVEFSRMHREFFARDHEMMTHSMRDLRDAIAAPRSNAKTTILGLIKLAHDCVYHRETFIVLFSATATLAEFRVKELRNELEYNAHLVEVFGLQVGDTWNNANFVTQPDAYTPALSGVRVMAASPGTQVRGLLEHGQRPSKLVLDDFEHSDHVTTQLQREKTERHFFEDILKLGQPGTNVVVIGTLLHPQGLLAGLLVNPGFTSQKYQAVLQFSSASAIPLWQEWRALFTDLDNPTHQEDARAFYLAHAEAMTEGADVLWPQRESYYDLMVMRLVEGETAFQIEKQNNPSRAEGHLFDMTQAGYFTMTPEALQRADGRTVAFVDIVDIIAFWDPAVGQEGNPDWSACVVVGIDRQGYMYVLDALMMQAVPSNVQETRIADLLWQWRVRRFGAEANMFQSLALGNVQQAMSRQAQERQDTYAPIYIPVHNTRNKQLRISTLQPFIANKHLWFANNLHPEFLRQMAVFRPIDGSDKDDGPDSLTGAVQLIKHLT